MPYKTPEEVIAAFNGILKKIELSFQRCLVNLLKHRLKSEEPKNLEKQVQVQNTNQVLQMEADREFLYTYSRCYLI